MRLLLVGQPAERARVRAELESSSSIIVGEFATLADARASRIEADAIMLADRRLRAAGAATDAGPPRFDGTEPFEEPLTPREIDVLELLAEGLSNKTIAGRLGISDQTVKFHVAAICGKLGAANRTEAVRLGIRRGLVSL